MLTPSERIKALRDRNKMSQADVATHLGMTPQTYATRESERTPWRLDELDVLSKLFGVGVLDILGDID